MYSHILYKTDCHLFYKSDEKMIYVFNYILSI